MSWRTTEISAESLRFANADGFLMLEEMDEINAVALQQGHGRQELDFLFDHRKVFSDEANG